MKHSIKIGQNPADPNRVAAQVEIKTHILCCVSWYPHHHTKSNYFGSSVIVCEDVLEEENVSSFIPMKRIANQCAIGNIKIELDYSSGSTETVLVAVPLNLILLCD